MNNREKIKIICRRPKDFLKEIINKKINLYSIKINKKDLEIVIDDKDIVKINEIKYIHKIKIIRYYGMNNIKYLIRKNKLFLLCVILGIIINILLSNIIFNIEVETSNQNLKKVLLNDLKNNNIEIFHIKPSKEKKKIVKEKILKKENNIIEWLEIKEQGTKYIIKVQERKINKKNEECYPRNIVSNKIAVITKIIAEEGEIIKKENDLVTKNEILISGLIYNNDKIVSKKCAVGKVYGEVWYKVLLSIPQKIKKEEYTNNKSYGISLKVFNKDYNFGNKYKTFKKNQYNIINSRIVPIKIGITKYRNTKIVIKEYDISNIDEYALNLAEERINKKLSNPVIINKKVLKKNINNSKIDVEVFFSVEEDITSYQDISSVNIDSINNETEE